jgi:hypothetical protein
VAEFGDAALGVANDDDRAHGGQHSPIRGPDARAL